MKKVRLIVLGAGGRGTIYARHALQLPGTAEVVAVAEPRAFFRDRLGDMHHIPAADRVSDWRELAEREKFADAVVIATQDRMHVEPAVAFARKGYHILIEKPLAPDPEGCRAIKDAVDSSGVVLACGLVLRYTNYTRALKKIVDSGVIGQILDIQHLEPVGYWRFAHAYVRGNWSREADSSSVLLAKSIHDLDWLCFIAGSRPARVQSFGSRMFFRRENQPEGAADRCLECPFRESCAYSAPRFYLGRIRSGEIDSYVESVTGDCTEENMLEVLKTSPYGRCVFACDNDVADHQVVSLELANGATATFTLAGCSRYGDRRTTIFGSLGEIRGDGGHLTCHTYFDGVTRDVPIPEHAAGDRHGGGDYNLLEAFVNAILTGDRSEVVSGMAESFDTHMLTFAAERSRLTGTVVAPDGM